MKKRFSKYAVASALVLSGYSANAFATPVAISVTVTSNAPTGGIILTPLWVGFHNGGFDSYDGGTASSAALEMLAEDGDASGLQSQLLSDTGGNGVGGTVGGLLSSGDTFTDTFIVDSTSGNNYFSYASMLLPTSDYYVANGNPFAFDISSLLSSSSGSLSFNIGTAGTVNDAGTEVNNFWTSAGNGLFAGTGLEDGGQSGPNQGADENGVNTNVTSANPFNDFIITNTVGTVLDIASNTLPLLNFNDTNLYTDGIATITLTASPVPVPAAAWLFGSALAGLVGVRRHRSAQA